MKKNLTLFLLLLTLTSVYAQEKTFTITGKPIVTIYANYHAGLGYANKNSGFELDRSYLGYEFKVAKNLGGKVIFDIGPTNVKGSDLERVAYVKNAMLTWTPGDFTLDFGLVKTEQFSLQENFWGYRYILKSFNDEYKFGSSADMGVIAKYKFNDWLEADVSLLNGEGYKKINKDNNYRYGAGITATPLKNIILRAYYDIYNSSGDSTRNQSSLALFAGYKNARFHIGAEYNKMFNTKFIDKQDQGGYSFYGSVNTWKKIAFFGRYDNLNSNGNWNTGNDGQRILAGVQYTPIKYLKIAPNFTNWNPRQGHSESFLYLNVEFKI